MLSVSSQRKYNFYHQNTLVDAFRTSSRNIIGRKPSMVIPLLANQDLTPMLSECLRARSDGKAIVPFHLRSNVWSGQIGCSDGSGTIAYQFCFVFRWERNRYVWNLLVKMNNAKCHVHVIMRTNFQTLSRQEENTK